MLVQTTFGHENFQRSSAKLQTFVCVTNDFPNPDKRETPMWAAARDNWQNVSRSGQLTKLPAAPGYRDEMGKWFTAQYDVPEGMYVKLWAQRKLEAQVAGRHLIAAMMVQIRSDAALSRVVVSLTGGGRATFQEAVCLEGRFDVVDLTTAVHAGYQVQRTHMQQFNDFNIEAMFRVVELARPIALRPEVEENVLTNSQGQQVRVRTRHRRRAIQV